MFYTSLYYTFFLSLVSCFPYSTQEQQEEVRYTRKPSGEVLQPLKGQYVIYNRSKLKHTLGHLKSFVFVLFFRIHTSYKKKQI